MVGMGGGCKGGKRDGGSSKDGNDSGNIGKGGSSGKGNDGNGEIELGQLATGDDRTEFGWSDTGVTEVIDMVVSMRQGPLSRPNTHSNKGDSIDRAGVQAKVKGAGEGSADAVSTLAARSMGNINTSGMCGRGIQVKGKGADVWRSQGMLCSGVSCTGSGDNLGLGSTSTSSGMRWVHCLYKAA